MKKRALLIFLSIFTFMSYSQTKEGQSFCEESKEDSYFPLGLLKKKILWGDTYYLES